MQNIQSIQSYQDDLDNRGKQGKQGRLRRQAGKLKRILGRHIIDQRGEGFVDVLVKMLLVVVIGAALLAIMRVAVPAMFTDMMTKIRDVFDL